MRTLKEESDAALESCIAAFAAFTTSREALAEARRRFRAAVEAEFGAAIADPQPELRQPEGRA
jgi:hypothetical protein